MPKKDWTNSKKWGYLGANSKRTSRHIKPMEVFFRICKKEGFIDEITYYDIKILVEKYPELKAPQWLFNFKDKDGDNPYLINKDATWDTGVYRLPSFDAVDEVELIYLAIDELPLEHLLKLPKLQHDVVLARYGINDGIVRTFKEVSEIVGLTEGYCWKLNQKALLKLEEYSGTKISINITPRRREKY